MGDSSASYIRMVQYLIEKCLLSNMDQEECAEVLSRHANVKPVITNTVWKELEKENKEFFEQYARDRQNRITVSEMASAERIQKLIADAAATKSPVDSNDDDDDRVG